MRRYGGNLVRPQTDLTAAILEQITHPPNRYVVRIDQQNTGTWSGFAGMFLCLRFRAIEDVIYIHKLQRRRPGFCSDRLYSTVICNTVLNFNDVFKSFS
jgi:hypothetical protein